MPSARAILNYLSRLLTRHAMFVVLIFGMCWVGWLGWTTMQARTDFPLSADRLTAKQIKVNETQRQQLDSALKSYRQPAPALKVADISLTPAGR